jgi:hypothetical protein
MVFPRFICGKLCGCSAGLARAEPAPGRPDQAVTLPRADGTRESSAPVVLLKSLNRYCFTCNLLANLLSNAAIQGQTHAPVF